MIEPRERTPLPVREGQGAGLLLWGYDSVCRLWTLARWLPAGVEGPVPDSYGFIAGEVLVDLPGVERYRLHVNNGLPARAFDGPPGREVSYTCPDCWFVTRHPSDIEARYCPDCHWPTSDPELAPARPGGRRRSRFLVMVPRLLVPAEWEGLTREGLAGLAPR